jgi:hypothetical protein
MINRFAHFFYLISFCSIVLAQCFLLNINISAEIGIRPQSVNGQKSNSYFQFSVENGKAIENGVELINSGDEEIKVEVKAKDAEITSDGNFSVLSASLANTKAGKWIKLDKEEIDIPAKSSVVVPFKITVPDDAKNGEYNAGMTVQQLGSSGDKKSGNVTIKTRNAVQMYITVGKDLSLNGVAERLNIIDPKDEDYQLQRKIRSNIGRDNFTVYYRAQNLGNINGILKSDYTITFPDGKTVKNTIQQEVYTNTPGKLYFFNSAGESYKVGVTKVVLNYELFPLTVKNEFKNSNVRGTLEDTLELSQEDFDKFGLAKVRLEEPKSTTENTGTVSKEQKYKVEKKEDYTKLIYIVIGLLGLILIVQLVMLFKKNKKKNQPSEIYTDNTNS